MYTCIYIYMYIYGLQDQVITKLKSSVGDWSGGVRIIFEANFLYCLYFHLRSELISG